MVRVWVKWCRGRGMQCRNGYLGQDGRCGTGGLQSRYRVYRVGDGVYSHRGGIRGPGQGARSMGGVGYRDRICGAGKQCRDESAVQG